MVENNAIYFQRGMPYLQWANSQASTRWATDEEVKKQFGISRAKWMDRWMGIEQKPSEKRKKA